MKGGSHLLIAFAGVAAIHKAITPLAASPWEIALVIGAAAVGALLPDIDSDESTIRQATATAPSRGCVGRVASPVIGLLSGGHRNLTHTLIVWLAFSLLAFWPGQAGPAIAFSAAYLLHLVADGLTVNGLPYLWPFYRRPIHLLPRPLRISTGSFYEYAVTVAVGVGVVQLWLVSK
jgi:membrane-bound metal-dependent hydrolase YbcI (DUF457 family)